MALIQKFTFCNLFIDFKHRVKNLETILNRSMTPIKLVFKLLQTISLEVFRASQKIAWESQSFFLLLLAKHCNKCDGRSNCCYICEKWKCYNTIIIICNIF